VALPTAATSLWRGKNKCKKNRTQKRYTNTEPECTEQQQIQGGANKCKRPSLYLQVQQPQQLRN